MKGKVNWFSKHLNYGFINGDDGREYFVHSLDLIDSINLYPGDEVEYDVKEEDRGPKAVKVRKLSKNIRY
jgi:CspA family cold shock protein